MTIIFKRIVSLARKRTRNSAQAKMILQELLPKFAAIMPEDGGMVEKLADIFLKPVNYNAYVLEIGFGSGENILFNAQNNPNYGYIGCEVFTDGVVTLLEDIQANQVDNIRIWHDDALELIPRLPINSLDLVYILHPDPWPKRRHYKRRLINEEFLRLLAMKLRKTAEVLIITDHDDYAKHITQVIETVADIFETKCNDYPIITKTKYRLKADAQGIESQYFCLSKK